MLNYRNPRGRKESITGNDGQEMILRIAIRRIWRKLRGYCITCGKLKVSRKTWFDKRYWYCSITCACYDGTMSVRAEVKKPRPRLLHSGWSKND